LKALAEIASNLRKGIHCTIPAADAGNGTIDLELVSDQMGGQNCHLDVDFDDDIKWIARLRLQGPTVPPQETQRKTLASEVNTLRFLETTNIPAPKLYSHSLESDEIGSPFILMEKMPGRPLQWYGSSAQQKTRIMTQLVDIFLELEKHPLTATGSLCEGGIVGPFAQIHTFSVPSQSLGPFDTLEKSLNAIENHEIKMIENGELSTLALDNYLTHLWRRERIPELVANVTDPRFYIRHFDDKGDHILVNEDFNITGIIDWEGASAEGAPFAFNSPCMMWPVRQYCSGSNALSVEETEFAAMFRQRGREDMEQMILQGRKYQRFLYFLGGTVPEERQRFEDLFQGLREAIEGPSIGSYAEWRDCMIALVREDPVFDRLLSLSARE
jgi:aminoglycoside phosphotransferase (APT) family kinase protein